ncbi:hypothetical protein CH563_07660 [Haemophilus influenzae]|uniref:Uncharacterized protein n=1 Tax=Haemophilus influenzae TaxID=727 RepID=A0A346K7Y4_HAEIF|nr:hypothetical protein NF38_00635 [Haemophilus influenzae]OBX81874.1 hypothetical protein A9506_00680 [Haemophilus aegyptius]OHQ61657.1 hypothetical protein HMPREF2644_00405 [Haemophilus sp. HMSC071C11]AOZ67406.1 hypothetical protein BG256_06470 [Haemophilus influenzae]AXP37182.1 hypothetical protein CH582_00620 [Haemophilus influenzae]
MIKFLRFFVIIFYSFKKCGEFDTVRRIMQDGDKIITVYFKDILKLKNLTIFPQHYNSDDFL